MPRCSFSNCSSAAKINVESDGFHLPSAENNKRSVTQMCLESAGSVSNAYSIYALNGVDTISVCAASFCRTCGSLVQSDLYNSGAQHIAVAYM